ncbi:hypothetical protein J6590_082090 [Homalodisca vitripennis]|nr:hypothetical protein J6590_082090 [Homalodisca vitripennis]
MILNIIVYGNAYPSVALTGQSVNHQVDVRSCGNSLDPVDGREVSYVVVGNSPGRRHVTTSVEQLGGFAVLRYLQLVRPSSRNVREHHRRSDHFYNSLTTI